MSTVTEKITNAINSALIPLAPGLVLKRKQAMAQNQLADKMLALSAYEAGKHARDTENWDSRPYSANKALEQRYTIGNRSRTAQRNDGTCKSIIGAYRRKVVGSGITARSAARNPKTAEPLDQYNLDMDTWWTAWCREADYVDIERRKTFLLFQNLMLEEWVGIGQAMAILCYHPRHDMVGLCLQAVEPEQLDTTLTEAPGSKNRIIGGIEVDKYSAAVAYWVHLYEHPLDYQTGDSVRVPASRVLHLFNPDRVQQVHGESRLAAVLREMWDLENYNQYTLIAAQIQACGGAAITGGETGGNYTNLDRFGTVPREGQSTTDPKGNRIMNLEPGHLWDLRGTGCDVKYHAPASPGQYHESYDRTLTTKAAAGAGLDYATVRRDFSQGTYSSQRQGLLETYQETDPMIVTMLDVVLRKVRNAFVRYAVLEGRVKAPNYLTDPIWRLAYEAADWQGPPKPWISPKDEALADKIAIDYKLKDRRGIVNRLGGDIREVFRQSGDEIAIARANNIVLPDDMEMTAKYLRGRSAN